MNKISARDLFRNPPETLLDIRSPGEFSAGHIPDALSFPLFDNRERAAIGSIYNHKGNLPATIRGLEYVGPRMTQMVASALRLLPEKRATIHCWRGGQRSAAMNWLLTFTGFDIRVVQGGYKAWRAAAREVLDDTGFNYIVIGGRTGSGKTDLLNALHDQGEQIIDLEKLACHKGSAFGWIGENDQPTTEQFSNILALELQKLDPSRRIWLENESKTIGRVYQPEGFHLNARNSPLINVIVDEQARLDRLVDMYAGCKQQLHTSFEKIKKRLGGQNFNHAQSLIESGDFASAAALALKYYDKTYQFGLDTALSETVIDVDIRSLDIQSASLRLIETADQMETSAPASNSAN